MICLRNHYCQKTKNEAKNCITNNMSTDLTLTKAQTSEIIKTGGFLGSLLRKLAVPSMKAAILLAEKFLAPLGVAAAASAIDAGIKKKIRSSGRPSSSAPQTTALIISNKEMNDIMKIVQALEDSNILLKRVTKTIKNETKEQKGRFLSMLLGYFRS